MTFNQLKNNLLTLLQGHAIIKQIRQDTPQEWMFKDNNPEFPLACYVCNSGSFEPGYLNYVVSFWFLDKSGREGEFEDEVISDQLQIANDVFSKLRQSHLTGYLVDDNVSFTMISDSFEDYLAGVRMDVTIKTVNSYDTCVFPAVS